MKTYVLMKTVPLFGKMSLEILKMSTSREELEQMKHALYSDAPEDRPAGVIYAVLEYDDKKDVT